MGKMIALAIAAYLVSMPARAENLMGNSYKGCVIALTGLPTSESVVDERYCLRLRENIKDSASEGG